MASSTGRRSYYDVLGVPPTADDKTIRKAYLRLSLKEHPDKHPEDPETAKARFVEIGQAYETLKDPILRAEYDRELRNNLGAGRPFTAEEAGGQAASAPNYETYRDFFDATVAGMSQADLAAAVGAAAIVGGIVGSIVASRLAKSNGLLASGASVVGSMVASQAAESAVLALHQESVERVAYAEERKRAMERGEPVPEPPANWKQRMTQSLKGAQPSSSQCSQKTSPRDSSSQSAEPRTWKEHINKTVNSAKEKAPDLFMQAATRVMKATKNSSRTPE